MTTKSKLLEFLIENQLLSREVVEAAEEELGSEDSQASVLEWLGRRGLIEEEQLAICLARHFDLPYVNLVTYPLDRDVVCSFSEELAATYHVLALRQDAGILTVAVADPLDRDAIRAVEQATQRPIRLALATATGVRDAAARVYNLESVLHGYLQNVPTDANDPVAQLEDDPSAIEGLRQHAALPSIVKLFGLVLLDAIRSEASEVHIDASATDVAVRYRIGGALRDAFRFPKWVLDPLVAHCKVLARLDPAQRAEAQVGRMRVRHADAIVTLRLSTSPSHFGENLALQLVRPGVTADSRDHGEMSANPAHQTRCCPECDQAVGSRATVCFHCDAMLGPACVQCGMSLELDWQTCPYCRTRVPRAALIVSHAGALPQKPGLPAGSISADSAPQRRFHVLVVDDEPDFRRIITTLLERSGLPVSVSVATHGPQALARAERDLPDLILLDVMMPDMDGFDVCARLRANVRTTFIPILMLTALNDPASRTRAFLVGTDDYLGKPFDRSELLARVRRMLQRTYGLQASEENVVATLESPRDSSSDHEAFLAPSNPTVGH